MITRLKKLFVSRFLVTVEILAAIGSGLLAGLIPQRISASADAISQWRLQHTGLVPLGDLLQLHTVYTSYWFVSVILLAGISLVFSTVDQARMARGRISSVNTSGLPLMTTDGLNPGVARSIAVHGYRQQITGRDGCYKFIRCKWGYWGASLFHFGMVLVIFASCFIALTERRGALTIAQGETLSPTDEWTSTEEGALARQLRLPATFRFDDLRIRYDERGAPEHIESLMTFIGADGTEERSIVAVNGASSYRGMRIYHSTEYGDAFTLEFIGPDKARHVEKLLMPHPERSGEAGYLDARLPWLPFTLSAKYPADGGQGSENRQNSQLIMRLMGGNGEQARITLPAGRSGQLGDYRVRLIAVDRWAKLIFADLHGMEVVFAGFALMMVGALLGYTMPPRELVIVGLAEGRHEVFWKATKFPEFYVDERDLLVGELRENG